MLARRRINVEQARTLFLALIETGVMVYCEHDGFVINQNFSPALLRRISSGYFGFELEAEKQFFIFNNRRQLSDRHPPAARAAIAHEGQEKKESKKSEIQMDQDLYVCAITYQVMRHPIIVPDGTHYELSALLQWLETSGKCTSPKTGIMITSLIYDLALKATLDKLFGNSPERHPDYEHKSALEKIQSLVTSQNHQILLQLKDELKMAQDSEQKLQDQLKQHEHELKASEQKLQQQRERQSLGMDDEKAIFLMVGLFEPFRKALGIPEEVMLVAFGLALLYMMKKYAARISASIQEGVAFVRAIPAAAQAVVQQPHFFRDATAFVQPRMLMQQLVNMYNLFNWTPEPAPALPRPGGRRE